MTLQFTVLASGSSGNASLLTMDGFGLLLDAGLGPRLLARRLAAVGASWDRVRAIVLTHTHADHWREPTLTYLRRRRIVLYCHRDHQRQLFACSTAFRKLHREGLVRAYDGRDHFEPTPGLRCRPLRLRHDGGATFGFRFEVTGDLFDAACTLAYVADLGSWDSELVQALADTDLLALEFNHDVALEKNSGRSPDLIERILGDEGHLSNAQAGTLLAEILQLSRPGRLRHVVQLHLSRECNRPELAIEAAMSVLNSAAATIQLHTACQYEPCRTLTIGGSSVGRPNDPSHVANVADLPVRGPDPEHSQSA